PGVLDAPDKKETGTLVTDLRGELAVRDVTLSYGEKAVLKNVSFQASAGTRTAIIGPTAAGKTQLLYMLTGLVKPNSGSVEYVGRNIDESAKQSLHLLLA